MAKIETRRLQVSKNLPLKYQGFLCPRFKVLIWNSVTPAVQRVSTGASVNFHICYISPIATYTA